MLNRIVLEKMLPKNTLKALLVAGLLFSTVAQSAVVRIGAAAFTPDAGRITFSEFAVGTVNPFYTPADYDGEPSSPNVNFGGRFLGQSGDNGVDCPSGAAASGCVLGLPTGPLGLDPNSPNTFIIEDSANPTSPVLTGTPTFNGPVSVLFDIDLAGVGLDGGFFDAIGGTAIRAFDRQGGIIGTVVNEALNIEFLGLVTTDGLAAIAGLQFFLVGAEPAGFAIDNLVFATAGQVVVPGQVPVPAALPLFASALGLGAIARRRKVAI